MKKGDDETHVTESVPNQVESIFGETCIESNGDKVQAENKVEDREVEDKDDIEEGCGEREQGEREQGDGQMESEDDEELDPRVEIELEKLNTASDQINQLEKELDEARTNFRQQLTDSTRDLDQLSKNLGNTIDKARPYFEALSQAKKAQQECTNAALTYERACDVHKGARKTISVAEDKLMNNPGMFDPAWQEMLNNANNKIMEAEKEKLVNEQAHHEAALAYAELEQRKAALEKQLKKTIVKARPYFTQKSIYLGALESRKIQIQELEARYSTAKKQYAESLRELERISEDIHSKRSRPSEREGCIGAEASSPRRLSRRVSDEAITKILESRKPITSTGRYRSSLILDLDVDFELEGSSDGSHRQQIALKSPSAKSVDMGCVSMKYYDDYQILDLTPFVDKDRQLRRSRSNPQTHGQSTPWGQSTPRGRRSSEFVVIQSPSRSVRTPRFSSSETTIAEEEGASQND